jgi:hypothetical protein
MAVVAFIARNTRDLLLAKLLNNIQDKDYNSATGSIVELIHAHKSDPHIVEPVKKTLDLLIQSDRPFQAFTAANNIIERVGPGTPLMELAVETVHTAVDMCAVTDYRATLDMLSEAVDWAADDLNACQTLSERLCELATAANDRDVEVAASILSQSMVAMDPEWEPDNDSLDAIPPVLDEYVPPFYADALHTLADRISAYDGLTAFDKYTCVLFGFSDSPERSQQILDKCIRIVKEHEDIGNLSFIKRAAGILATFPVLSPAVKQDLIAIADKAAKLSASTIAAPKLDLPPISPEKFLAACPTPS